MLDYKNSWRAGFIYQGKLYNILTHQEDQRGSAWRQQDAPEDWPAEASSTMGGGLIISMAAKSQVTFCYINNICNNTIINSNHKSVPSWAEGRVNLLSEQAMTYLFYFQFFLFTYLFI